MNSITISDDAIKIHFASYKVKILLINDLVTFHLV